ncbi:hypothetical protein EJ110_NYTH27333 [Nymphaea thermarum]|nr:hypothetical protein EJ110_NYTH27333 [Nymphaea thermarum]
MAQGRCRNIKERWASGSDQVFILTQKERVIAYQLAVASKPIDDDDLVSYILRSLSAEYLVLKTSMETGKESIGLNELYGLLLMQETNLTSHDNDIDLTMPAENNIFKGNNEWQQNYWGRGKNYYNKNKNFQAKERPMCQIYEKIGM